MEILQELLALVLPVLRAAVVLLGAFALWALKNYLDSLKRRATTETDETIAAQTVSAVEQLMADSEGVEKEVVAQQLLSQAGVKSADHVRLIEDAVGVMRRRNGGG